MVPEFQTHGIWEHDKMVVVFATKLGVVFYTAVDKGNPCESAFDFSSQVNLLIGLRRKMPWLSAQCPLSPTSLRGQRGWAKLNHLWVNRMWSLCSQSRQRLVAREACLHSG